MRDRYRLEGLRDDQLLAALSAIVVKGNQATADLLAHLAEVDERQLYAELGFPSLWAYCVECGAAHRGGARVSEIPRSVRVDRAGTAAHLGVVFTEAVRERREPGGAVRAVQWQKCATGGG